MTSTLPDVATTGDETPTPGPYHTNLSTIADALQRVVDDLRAAGDVEITSTSISIQFLAETTKTGAVHHMVDTVLAAIAPQVRATDRRMKSGPIHYSTDYLDRVRAGDIDISVFGQVEHETAGLDAAFANVEAGAR